VVRPRHVYVHIPFCARRCTYCDFSIAVRARPPVDDYLAALRTELTLRYPAGIPWAVDTIYLGGGTPSALGQDVARVLELLGEFVQPADGAEVTVEANPEHVNRSVVSTWRAAGVNRMSLGAQSFDPAALRWMHRTHGVADITRAVSAAQSAGIDNVSLDLIFALPERIGRDWADDLNRALALRPAHLSLYGLTVEPKTPLGRWVARGTTQPPDDETYAQEFLAAHEAATVAGYEHYEVSNFALPGFRSRHNASYWSGAPYAGLGPSAHEFDGATRRWNVAPYAAWSTALRAGADPRDGAEELTPAEQATERVYLGLRTADGLAVEPGDDRVLDSWVTHQWVERRDARAILTPHGWLRLDALAADLTYVRSRSYF
jgi:oxygen-independent coproporphyrinogen III oxidase